MNVEDFIFVVIGSVLTFTCYFLLKGLLNEPKIVKENYAQRAIPTLGGLVVLLSLLCSVVINVFSSHLNESKFEYSSYLILFLGFGFIGLIDDLLGDKNRQGFRGHIGALVKGKITTGAIKLFGGPIIAFLSLAGHIPSQGFVSVFIDCLAISLLANFFNLLDLAPGRLTKIGLISACILLGFFGGSTFVFAFAGILLVSLILDLKEKYMLGDTGANIIGALIGLIVVENASEFSTYWILLGAFVLNFASEIISFSKIIESVSIMRWFDQLGQTKERKAWVSQKRAK